MNCRVPRGRPGQPTYKGPPRTGRVAETGQERTQDTSGVTRTRTGDEITWRWRWRRRRPSRIIVCSSMLLTRNVVRFKTSCATYLFHDSFEDPDGLLGGGHGTGRLIGHCIWIRRTCTGWFTELQLPGLRCVTAVVRVLSRDSTTTTVRQRWRWRRRFGYAVGSCSAAQTDYEHIVDGGGVHDDKIL